MWRIGTCGWQYRDWRGPLYPPGLPQRRWLAHYAERYPTVEVDSSFYQLPTREATAAWAAAVPDGFCFAAKASRYLTHVRRLAEPAEPVARLLDRLEPLGEHLGPLLIQLPPTFKADHDRLDACLAAFPKGVRLAVEPRHPSWEVDRTRSVLERHGATWCLADREGPLGRWGEAVSGWAYVRFHWGRSQPPGCYGRAALRAAVERLEAVVGTAGEAWVYFNNDPGACAVANAATFARVAARRGVLVQGPLSR